MPIATVPPSLHVNASPLMPHLAMCRKYLKAGSVQFRTYLARGVPEPVARLSHESASRVAENRVGSWKRNGGFQEVPRVADACYGIAFPYLFDWTGIPHDSNCLHNFIIADG